MVRRLAICASRKVGMTQGKGFGADYIPACRRDPRDTMGSGCGRGYSVEIFAGTGFTECQVAQAGTPMPLLRSSFGLLQAGGAGDETGDFWQGISEATAEFGGREFFGLVGMFAFGAGELRKVA